MCKKARDTMSRIKNVPKSIYLNIDGDISDCKFNDLSEITWSEEKINKNDIKYSLVDNDELLNASIDLITMLTEEGFDHEFDAWGRVAFDNLKNAVYKYNKKK